MSTYICGKCHFEFNEGVSVCQGCHGQVVYGATAYEQGEAGKLGAMVWGAIALVIMFGVPELINQKTEMHVTLGYGLGLFSIVPIGVAAMFGYMRGVSRVVKEKKGTCRTF